MCNILKLQPLGMNTSLYNWILDFLTEWPQTVRIRNIISAATTLRTGAPRDVCSSNCCSHYVHTMTHNCSAKYDSNHIIIIHGRHNTGGLHQQQWWEGVQRCSGWHAGKQPVCHNNWLQKGPCCLQPFLINSSRVEQVRSFLCTLPPLPRRNHQESPDLSSLHPCLLH